MDVIGTKTVSFEEQVVLITGARTGIGRHLAEFFVGRGARVIGVSRGAAEWSLSGYEHHTADVADERAVATVVQQIGRSHGRLDVAVNNAGIASMNHALLTPAATVERIFATNVVGTFVVSREAAKLMRRAKRGRIVNVSTVAVPMCIEGEAAYAASKSAVETLTRVLAREFAPFNITCNAVGPTPIETDLIARVPKQKIQSLVDRLAVKRLGRFEDVANVVEFFARPESDYVTGQVVYLGGA
jgi:3-oxoacyl-[acyl-carrier protein] reductase